MMTVLSTIIATVAARFGLWLAIVLGFVSAYYAGLLLTLVVRFGELPNYLTIHHFFHNIAVIVRSTPSVRDMVPIALDEWLVEVGYMNRDFGHGIAEWSLELIPAKLMVVVALGALVATNLLLVKQLPKSCTRATSYSGTTVTGIGAALVGFTSITMMWVVCCASPTWAVGLALLGVGVSTAFGLQPFGTAITLAGFALLLTATYLLARASPRAARRESAGMPQLVQHHA
jgi:hypothetical protein